jgi:hypothetical protein
MEHVLVKMGTLLLRELVICIRIKHSIGNYVWLHNNKYTLKLNNKISREKIRKRRQKINIIVEFCGDHAREKELVSHLKASEQWSTFMGKVRGHC